MPWGWANKSDCVPNIPYVPLLFLTSFLVGLEPWNHPEDCERRWPVFPWQEQLGVSGWQLGVSGYTSMIHLSCLVPLEVMCSSQWYNYRMEESDQRHWTHWAWPEGEKNLCYNKPLRLWIYPWQQRAGVIMTNTKDEQNLIR